MSQEEIITPQYLNENPNHIFVFGDNLLRVGKGGAAILRDEPNTYGFVTKIAPDNRASSFYTPEEYQEVFDTELQKLIEIIASNPDKLYLISKLGAGLANRNRIFEMVISAGVEVLKEFENVKFLYSATTLKKKLNL